MTKDGRPSPLKDIRLFHETANAYLKDCDEAWAFGRRLAWWLNGEGFSAGSGFAVYIQFTAALPEGAVAPGEINRDRDSWQMRQVAVGVARDFPASNAAQVVMDGIVASLKALAPEHSDLIDRAAAIVAAAGADCRFLLKSKETSAQVMDVSSTIATWPQPSRLFVSLTDKATGLYRQAPPVEMRNYDDAVLLAGKVKIVRGDVNLAARSSSPAKMTADRHGGDLSWRLEDFVQTERPRMSSPLKFR